MGDLIRDINALPDDVDEELTELFLRLAKNDPSLPIVDLRFKLEGIGALLPARRQASAPLTPRSIAHPPGDLELMVLARCLEANTVVKDLTLATNKLGGARLFSTGGACGLGAHPLPAGHFQMPRPRSSAIVSAKTRLSPRWI
jgi:hypothetical protein